MEKNFRISINKTPAYPTEEDEQPFTIEELDIAIGKMKVRKAPGPDNIHPEQIIMLGKSARRMLLNIFNHSWDNGWTPQSWKSANIIPLLKNGKPKDQVSSYRPISLTSHISKLMERMIERRLCWRINEGQLLCDNQWGFRPERCTEDKPLLLTQSVINGLGRKEKAVAVAFNFSKPFDNVWRTAVLVKMTQKGIPHRYIKCIKSLSLIHI